MRESRVRISPRAPAGTLKINYQERLWRLRFFRCTSSTSADRPIPPAGWPPQKTRTPVPARAIASPQIPADRTAMHPTTPQLQHQDPLNAIQTVGNLMIIGRLRSTDIGLNIRIHRCQPHHSHRMRPAQRKAERAQHQPHPGADPVKPHPLRSRRSSHEDLHLQCLTPPRWA